MELPILLREAIIRGKKYIVPGDCSFGTILSLSEMKEWRDALNVVLRSSLIEEDIDNYNSKIMEQVYQQQFASMYIPKGKPAGFVYLFRSDIGIKIGVSKKVNERRKAIQSSIGMEVTEILSKKVPDYYQVEQYLHYHFDDKRIRNEWFNLNDDDISFCDKFLSSLEVA